jgi:hypothetical protein
MMTLRGVILLLGAAAGLGLAAQAPTAVDTSAIGPRVGVVVPPVSGVDQFGKPQSLASVRGSKGTMLVFFRSAEW